MIGLLIGAAVGMAISALINIAAHLRRIANALERKNL